MDTGRLGAQQIHIFFRVHGSRLVIYKPKMGDAGKMSHIGVIFYIQAKSQPVPLSVLCRITDPMFYGLDHGIDLHRLSLQAQFHMVCPVSSENTPHQFGTPCSHQTGNAQYLPFSHIEITGVYLVPPAHIPGLQRHLPQGPHIFGVFVLQGASHDHVHQLIHGDISQVPGPYVLAIADNGDPLTDLVHLSHPVGDVDHAHSLFLQPAYNPKQLLDFPLCQCGRGLIQHQYL